MNLKPQDIEISLVQADHEHNLGNWSMQTCSGVVLYHKPTSIQVRCTEHKSQWKNKAAAVKLLEGRLENVTENLDVYWTFKDRPYLVGTFMGSNTEILFKFVYEDGVCGFTVFGEDKRYNINEVVILRSYTLEELLS